MSETLPLGQHYSAGCRIVASACSSVPYGQHAHSCSRSEKAFSERMFYSDRDVAWAPDRCHSKTEASPVQSGDQCGLPFPVAIYAVLHVVSPGSAQVGTALGLPDQSLWFLGQASAAFGDPPSPMFSDRPPIVKQHDTLHPKTLVLFHEPSVTTLGLSWPLEKRHGPQFRLFHSLELNMLKQPTAVYRVATGSMFRLIVGVYNTIELGMSQLALQFRNVLSIDQPVHRR